MSRQDQARQAVATLLLSFSEHEIRMALASLPEAYRKRKRADHVLEPMPETKTFIRVREPAITGDGYDSN